jgi:glycosyltransferase involved in cell wall biosynthesis
MAARDDIVTAGVDTGQTSASSGDEQLHVLICLAAAKVSEPRLSCYQKMPEAEVQVVGYDRRPPAPNLVRFPAWRVPFLGAPERWTAALSWFRGFKKFVPGETGCVISMETLNPTSLQASHLAKRLGVPHVVTIAEILPKNPIYFVPPWRNVARVVIRSADAFVCSVELARQFAIGKGCPPERCVVINPGIDLQRFSPRPGGRTKDPVMLFVGELRPDKGILDVLVAVELARREVPGLRLVILGDGPLRPEVERKCRQDPLLEYRGRLARDELPLLYQEARAFILAPYTRPYWAEQFGFASVEAMASGLPIVITDCGAVREIVPDWNPICPEQDVPALTAGIVAAVGREGDEWGRRNRESAEERFDIDIQAARLRTWLGELCAVAGRREGARRR